MPSQKKSLNLKLAKIMWLRNPLLGSSTEFQGPKKLKFEELPKLNTSFNLAIPLQSLGGVQIFDFNPNLSKSAFGCEERLKITKG